MKNVIDNDTDANIEIEERFFRNNLGMKMKLPSFSISNGMKRYDSDAIESNIDIDTCADENAITRRDEQDSKRIKNELVDNRLWWTLSTGKSITERRLTSFTMELVSINTVFGRAFPLLFIPQANSNAFDSGLTDASNPQTLNGIPIMETQKTP